MIFKPTNMTPDNSTFSASSPIELKWKSSGDIMTAFEVTVENNSTGVVVYSSGKISSFSASHIIPAGTLTNGVVYRYKIKVYNSANAYAVSDYKILKCNSTPIVSLINDGVIRNQIATVKATYSQAEGITLKAYRFVLYDKFSNQIESSQYYYNQNLEHTFETSLIDGTEYKIECLCITQNDLIGSSGKISVIADYIPPSVHFLLKAENEVDKPYVKLSWTTVRIIGEANKTPVYINDSKIDLRDSIVRFDKGFTLEGNFSLKFWIQSPKQDVDLIVIYGTNGSIAIKYYGNKFHAYKNASGIVSHVASGDITFNPDGSTILVLQQEGNRLNLINEVN